MKLKLFAYFKCFFFFLQLLPVSPTPNQHQILCIRAVQNQPGYQQKIIYSSNIRRVKIIVSAEELHAILKLTGGIFPLALPSRRARLFLTRLLISQSKVVFN